MSGKNLVSASGQGTEQATNEVAAECGEWIVPSVSYVDPSRRFCAFCGRPIARRYWRVGTGGTDAIFCDPGHARLQVTYQ
jgi:hypothetical protein